MTRATFTPEEWETIVRILHPKPEEEPSLRRVLLRWREWGRDRAGIRVDRNRKAAADLTALRDALAALAVPLARVRRDAAPGAHTDAVRRMREVFGPRADKTLRQYEGSDSTAVLLMRGAATRKGYALPSDKGLQRFSVAADRLRELADDALRRLGPANKGGRPAKSGDHRTSIKGLARLYESATGKRATSTKSGPFVELVRVVLGLGGINADAGRAAELVRASLAAAKPAKRLKPAPALAPRWLSRG